MNSIIPHDSDDDPHGVVDGPPPDLPFHLLNDAERECLRLVDQGYTSKQIAADRNVRRDTIDKILRVARAKLGNLPRHELARRFVEHETLQHSKASSADEEFGTTVSPAQSVGVQSVGLATVQEMSSSGLPVSPNDGNKGESPPMAVTTLLDLTNIEILRLLFGSHRSPRNELDQWSGMAAISVIAAGAAFVAVAIIPLLIMLDRIVGGL